MKKHFFIILLISTSIKNYAQLNAEIFGGDKQIAHEFFFSNNFTDSSRFSYFNYTNFTVDYRDRLRNGVFTNSLITYSFNRRQTGTVGLSGGGTFAATAFGTTFAPALALNIDFFDKTGGELYYINIFPGVVYNNNRLNADLFLFAIYNPPLQKKENPWGLFIQAIAGINSTGNFDTHNNSFFQLRIGPSKNRWQFGVGTNIAFGGNSFTQQNNTGVFLRRSF